MSGTSHSSGTAATFCVRWLVTASSSTEPVADSASHSSHGLRSSAAVASSGDSIAWRGVIQAIAAQASAKAANSHDHTCTCCTPPRNGSTMNG